MPGFDVIVEETFGIVFQLYICVASKNIIELIVKELNPHELLRKNILFIKIKLNQIKMFLLLINARKLSNI